MDGIGHLIVDEAFLAGLKSIKNIDSCGAVYQAADEIADQVVEIREVFSLLNNHENNEAIEKLALIIEVLQANLNILKGA